jgi:hypothetical protein
MSADDLLQWVAQALFVLIFLVTGARAFRRPLRASIDIALFFGALSVVIAEGWVVAALDATPGRALNALNSALIMALPYLLLRLVDDFADVPRWLLHAAEAGLALAVIGLVAMAPPLPAGLTLLYVAYFVGLQIYAAAMFVREARRANGLTCRRMQAAAAGSVCLSLTILAAGLQSSLPDTAGLWMLLPRLRAAVAAAAGLAGAGAARLSQPGGQPATAAGHGRDRARVGARRRRVDRCTRRRHRLVGSSSRRVTVRHQR